MNSVATLEAHEIQAKTFPKPKDNVGESYTACHSVQDRMCLSR